MTELIRTNIQSEKRFALMISWIMFISLEFLVIIQAVLAYRDNFLTVNQIQNIHILQGLPFLWHFGMWGDFFIISPVVAYLVRHYLNQWRFRSVLLSFTIGAISACLFGWLFTLSAVPEAHMQNHHLTSAGIIHLVYMAVAVTIFLEFFLFTPSVLPSELKVVSSLVVLHVFLGTHIALGILQFIIRLDWYPGKPLKSIIGYLTISTITTVLFLRNLQVESFAKKVQSTVERLALPFMYWLEDDIYAEEKVKTPHGLLTFLDKMGDRILEVSFFIGAAWSIISQNEGIKSLLPGILVFVFAAKFRLSRRSVKVELSISEKLFPSGQLPEDWSGPREPVGIIVSVIYFFVLYMALAWFANNIILVSLVMFVIACIDWNTRRMIHNNIRRLFLDERYTPKIGDKDFEAIVASRETVNKYLFNNPQLWKEGGCAAGCGFALIVAVISYVIGSDWLRYTAYILIIVTLLTNEIVTSRWRAVRDQSLKQIEKNKRIKALEIE